MRVGAILVNMVVGIEVGCLVGLWLVGAGVVASAVGELVGRRVGVVVVGK